MNDKRPWLFGLICMLALVLGFWAVPSSLGMKLVGSGGFWWVLVTFGIFLHALWQTFRWDLVTWHWRRIDWPTVAIIGVGSAVLLVHEAFGFKIIMDEITLLGTSMNMHFNKEVLTPFRGNDIQGTFVLLGTYLDKRPLFFPFLVSLIHDLTGYRPANVFVLNSILTVVFMMLVNLLGRMLAGKMAGWLAVLLCTGLPLLAHNATGAGFELLNLVMLIGTLLLGIRYVGQSNGASLTAFVFSALLLAQVRYESVLFFIPVALIIGWVWYRDRVITLPWTVLISPLLMVHYPLHHRIFSLQPQVWELASKPGYTTPFSLGYIPENLSHAVAFFFASPANQPNSLLFSALGCIAVPFFLLLIVKRLRNFKAQDAASLTTTVFALGFAAHFLLMMGYFWGRFDEPVIRRLSLPTHLGLLIALLAVLPQFGGIKAIRTLLGAAALAVLAAGVPSMAAHKYSQQYLPGLETAWRRAFIKTLPRRDYLVIDNDAMLWVSHKVSATPIGQALRRPDAIAFHIRNRTFSEIFVYQRFNIDEQTGAMTLREGDDLGPNFVLETIREERLQYLTLSRLSRLKEIREGGVSRTIPEPESEKVTQDRAEIEKARRVYLENYIKQLP